MQTEPTPAAQTEPTPEPGATPAPQPATGTEPSTQQAQEPVVVGDDWTPQLPEGVELDAELLGSFRATAKEAGLTAENAQKMVAAHVEAQKKAEEATLARWAQRQKAWMDEVKADPEFGGVNYAKNQDQAAAVLKKYGSDKLVGFLQDAGVSNHPELVRFVMRVGAAMAEDSVSGTTAPPAKQEYEDPFFKLYDRKA